MTLFHGLQLAVAALGAGLFAARFYRLSIRSAIDTRAFLEAFSEMWLGGSERPALGGPTPRETLERLLERESGRAVVRLAKALSQGPFGPRDGEIVRAELRHEAERGIGVLRMLGRVASPLAFSGVMFDMAASLGGEQGLVALQRGLAQQLALERAVLSVCIGVATSLFCFAGAARLRLLSGRRSRDLDLTSDVLQTLRQGASGRVAGLREET